MIRIIHISDLHISTDQNNINLLSDLKFGTCKLFNNNYKKSFRRPTSYSHKSLARVLEYINKENAHYTLLTGDIATTGFKEDLLYSKEILYGDAPITDNSYEVYFKKNTSLLLLPGNHDRYKTKFRPGSTVFDKIYKKKWKNKEININIITEKKSKNSLALIRLDLSLPSNHLNIIDYPGKGKSTSSILKKLQEKIDKVRESNSQLPILCAIHFSPDTTNALSLINKEKFISLLKRNNISHLFCGHTHQEKLYTKLYAKNNISIYCSGSTSSCADTNSFLIHEIVFKEKNKLEINSKIKYLST